MIDIQKWRFQVTKLLKINIMKHSTKKYSTDHCLINLNRHVLYVCAYLINLEKRRIRVFTHHLTIIYFQKRKLLLHFSVRP